MIKINGTVSILGKEVRVIENGFKDNRKCILASDIALEHGVETKYINKQINANILKFENEDLIDFLSSSDELRDFAKDNNLIGSNRTKNVFLLSEMGYLKLIKIMDDNKSWDIYNALLQDYFKTKDENLELKNEASELFKISTSDKNIEQRTFEAKLSRYSWKRIKPTLESCDYKTIEDTSYDIVEFHSGLNKKHRANYDSHQNANNTEYKQIVRKFVKSTLDNMYLESKNTAMTVVLSIVKEDILKDVLETTNRSTSKIISNLSNK